MLSPAQERANAAAHDVVAAIFCRRNEHLEKGALGRTLLPHGCRLSALPEQPNIRSRLAAPELQEDYLLGIHGFNWRLRRRPASGKHAFYWHMLALERDEKSQLD